MKLLSTLSSKDRRKIREVVASELERVRLFNSLGNLVPEQQAYCETVNKAAERLPSKERIVIQERYLKPGNEYLRDFDIYNMVLEPPVSAMTYSRIRDNAMIKLSLALGIDTGVKIDI